MQFREFMQSHTVVTDGGLGSLLAAKGLPAGTRPESWNLTHPEIVKEIHKAYYEAGSNLVYTNTFGVNGLHYTPEEQKQLVNAAVRLVREAAAEAASPYEKFAALDIGPLGRLLRPFGDLEFEEAVGYFASLVRLGRDAGVDVIVLETLSDAYETKAALLAARENTDLPILVSNAYGENGRLLTGTPPEAVVLLADSMGADAVGVNCSFGPEQLLPVARKYLQNTRLPFSFKPNGGLPRVENGKTVYDLTPDDFASLLMDAARQGTGLLGGCCGTAPEHIRALRRRLDAEAGKERDRAPRATETLPAVSSYGSICRLDEAPIIIGERLNPTGKKKIREALCEENWSALLQEAFAQEQAGAQVLDVNVGVPGLNEPALMKKLVTELQAVCPLPLQLDSSDPAALEAGLRLYNGTAIINSVNGKKESMDAVFPLAQKYGGAVVALTLDENGIPETAEGRVQIARRILAEAQRRGISGDRLLFDALTMTVGANASAADVTLETIDRIRRELGCRTVLGVSNISFGMPNRPKLNAAFLTLALEHGLQAAIMNPLAAEMRQAFELYLHRKDSAEDAGRYEAWLREQEKIMESVRCGRYVEAETAALRAEEAAPAGPSQPEAAQEDLFAVLQQQVRTGLRAAAGETADKLLMTEDPICLMDRAVLPALDEVGRGYESGRLYLPQLLMSAEAASEVFGKLREVQLRGKEMPESREKAIVLATVQGDIHDIGKNIVRLLLESHGIGVRDLGRNVAAEAVAEAVLQEKAPAVGLSALMTTTVPAMEAAIRLLREKCPGVRIVVGGAVLSEKLAEKIGADAYAKDATDAVRFVQAWTAADGSARQ